MSPQEILRLTEETVNIRDAAKLGMRALAAGDGANTPAYFALIESYAETLLILLERLQNAAGNAQALRRLDKVS